MRESCSARRCDTGMSAGEKFCGGHEDVTMTATTARRYCDLHYAWALVLITSTIR